MVSRPYVSLLITFESIAGLGFTLFMNIMLLEVTPPIVRAWIYDYPSYKSTALHSLQMTGKFLHKMCLAARITIKLYISEDIRIKLLSCIQVIIVHVSSYCTSIWRSVVVKHSGLHPFSIFPSYNCVSSPRNSRCNDDNWSTMEIQITLNIISLLILVPKTFTASVKCTFFPIRWYTCVSDWIMLWAHHETGHFQLKLHWPWYKH